MNLSSKLYNKWLFCRAQSKQVFQMKNLFYSLKSKEINGMEYYAKCNIAPSENKAAEHKQQVIDYAHHVNTMDFCINRVNSFIEAFKN